jgi:hypothetical protein
METSFFGGYVCITSSLYPENFFYLYPDFSNSLLTSLLSAYVTR